GAATPLLELALALALPPPGETLCTVTGTLEGSTLQALTAELLTLARLAWRTALRVSRAIAIRSSTPIRSVEATATATGAEALRANGPRRAGRDWATTCGLLTAALALALPPVETARGRTR